MQSPPPGAYHVTDSLLAGRYPLDPGALVRAGVTEFVDLTGHGPGYERLLPEHANRASFPITDFGTPSIELMTEILDHIDSRLPSGVYVHCAGGIGRTGTVIGCWLIRHGLADATTWQETLDELRPPGSYRSPETDAQRAFVTAWEPGH